MQKQITQYTAEDSEDLTARHECADCSGPGDGDVIRQALGRRDFMRMGVGGMLGTLIAHWIGTDRAVAEEGAQGRARSCILLWMNGGPSHLDTWDPKPNSRNGGKFAAINTKTSGVQICEHMPRIAEVMDRISLIRSMTSKEGNHERAQYLVHTGYSPTPTAVHPSLGALIAYEKGNKSLDLPNFVSIGNGSMGAGFLGVAAGPFVVPDPLKPIENLSYPDGVDRDRFIRRLRLMNYFESNLAKETGDKKVPDRDAVYWKAIRMMHSPLRRAFDLDEEPAAVRRAYGEESTFGQGCLMARRLVSSGVKFVEVRLDGWDTHSDNFTRVEKQLTTHLDPGMSSLILDLEQRKLLDTTLVIWMGEFGRTPQINANDGRDHYPKAWSVALAGGGIRPGQVIGATSADGTEIADRPVEVKDLFATIGTLAGLDITKINYTNTGRPMPVVDRGAKPVDQLIRA